MSKCVYCGAETELEYDDTPICPACASERQEKQEVDQRGAQTPEPEEQI